VHPLDRRAGAVVSVLPVLGDPAGPVTDETRAARRARIRGNLTGAMGKLPAALAQHPEGTAGRLVVGQFVMLHDLLDLVLDIDERLERMEARLTTPTILIPSPESVEA